MARNTRILLVTTAGVLLLGACTSSAPEKRDTPRAPIVVTTNRPLESVASATATPSARPLASAAVPQATLAPASALTPEPVAPVTGGTTAAPTPAPRAAGVFATSSTDIKLDQEWKVIVSALPKGTEVVLRNIIDPTGVRTTLNYLYRVEGDTLEIPYLFPSKNQKGEPYSPAWKFGTYTFRYEVKGGFAEVKIRLNP